jgi:beta-1,4-mannosyltransferase
MSSSNYDLPMKVVDMFSCKVPCFAYDYPTINELVITEESGSGNPTGCTFKNEKELLNLFLEHFGEGVDAAVDKLEVYRKNLDKFVAETWKEHWKDVILYQKEKGLRAAAGDGGMEGQEDLAGHEL